jgi:hypothetical protein
MVLVPSVHSSAMRVPTAKTARVADRPHQLQRLLGQPVSHVVDCRRLRANAGVAPASRRHRLCAGSGLDTARTVVETGCACAGLGATHGGAPTRILSVSSHLPESGGGTRSLARITLASPSLKPSLTLSRNCVRGNTLSANRCLANFYTQTSSPTSPHNQKHPDAIMFGAISSPHNPLSLPSRIKRVRSDNLGFCGLVAPGDSATAKGGMSSCGDGIVGNSTGINRVISPQARLALPIW